MVRLLSLQLFYIWIASISCDKRIYEEYLGNLTEGDVLTTRGKVLNASGGPFKFRIGLCENKKCSNVQAAITIDNKEMLSVISTFLNGAKQLNTIDLTKNISIERDRDFKFTIALEEKTLVVQFDEVEVQRYEYDTSAVRYFAVTEIGADKKPMLLINTENDLRNDTIENIALGDLLTVSGNVTDDNFHPKCDVIVLNVHLESDKMVLSSLENKKWSNTQIIKMKTVSQREFHLGMEMEKDRIVVLESTNETHLFNANFEKNRHLRIRCIFTSVKSDSCGTQIWAANWTHLITTTTESTTEEPTTIESTTPESNKTQESTPNQNATRWGTIVNDEEVPPKKWDKEEDDCRVASENFAFGGFLYLLIQVLIIFGLYKWWTDGAHGLRPKSQIGRCFRPGCRGCSCMAPKSAARTRHTVKDTTKEAHEPLL